MRRLAAILVFSVGAALILLSLYYPELTEKPPNQETEIIRVPPPPSAPIPETITLLPIAADASSTLAYPDATTEDDLSTIELLLSEYARHHQGNPIGENIEIAEALFGKNPSRVAYLENEGPFLNASKELIDRWGTPYFFHQISARQTEIRSAGPDRELNTDDDLIR